MRETINRVLDNTEHHDIEFAVSRQVLAQELEKAITEEYQCTALRNLTAKDAVYMMLELVEELEKEPTLGGDSYKYAGALAEYLILRGWVTHRPATTDEEENDEATER